MENDDKRKAQLREAQRTYRAKKKKEQGKKPQSFLFSQADHDNMTKIKEAVPEVKNKEQALSYALAETAKNLPANQSDKK